jgi:hypothetical protein
LRAARTLFDYATDQNYLIPNPVEYFCYRKASAPGIDRNFYLRNRKRTTGFGVTYVAKKHMLWYNKYKKQEEFWQERGKSCSSGNARLLP